MAGFPQSKDQGVVRVVGTDPGTSSLDLLLMEDGQVIDQRRFRPEELLEDTAALTTLLHRWSPLSLIAGPSGYGLPLVAGADLTDDHLDQMSLVRPDQRSAAAGVVGFRSWVRALVQTGLPIVFLPGGFHLPTIPRHRKVNAVDLGTADKVAVAALALWFDARDHEGFEHASFAVVEVGSAFTAILVIQGGRLVAALAGTHGPIGLKSRGAWDGEAAYWSSPLSKSDLFRGGVDDLGALGHLAFRESLVRHLAGLQAVAPFSRIYLSGAGLNRPEIAELTRHALAPLGRLIDLPTLPGAWVKHAAQGSAVLADALLGGGFAKAAESLDLRAASGSVWDVLDRPRT